MARPILAAPLAAADHNATSVPSHGHDQPRRVRIVFYSEPDAKGRRSFALQWVVPTHNVLGGGPYTRGQHFFANPDRYVTMD